MRFFDPMRPKVTQQQVSGIGSQVSGKAASGLLLASFGSREML
jgi:hypothetical protein